MNLLLLKNNISIKTSLNYEEHIYKKIYFYFYELFKPLLNLEKNDKLGIIEYINTINYNINYVNTHLINYKFCIYKKNIFQPILRWINKQNRVNTFAKLDIVFEEYYIIIKKLKILRKEYNNNFEQIYYTFNYLNSLLLNKINILINSYRNDNLIIEYTNKYINYLKLFNNK